MATTREPPTILLVHGGGHGHPIYFKGLQEWLTHYGIPSIASTAPSNDTIPPPGQAMYGDAAHWRMIITNLIDAGKDVIVFMHSVGGIVGMEASQHLGKKECEAQGRPGGIVHFIFLGSYLAVEGENTFEVHNKHGLGQTLEFHVGDFSFPN